MIDTTNIGTCMKFPLFNRKIVRGRGIYLYDDEGAEYIDMLSGAAVANFGYGNKHFTDVYTKTANKIQHTAFCYTPNSEAVAYANKLITITPGSFSKKVVFGTSGSDAIDGAVKMARAYTQREGIISFRYDYHGSTGISINVTSWDGISKPNSNYYHVSFPNFEQEVNGIIDSISEIIETNSIAAIVLEPIQGDAGVIIPPTSFFQQLFVLCKKKNVVTIADEIQTGMGRTGTFWAIEHFNVEPDIIVAAKSLSGGYAPLSVIIGREEIVESLQKGQHVFTYGGHPPSCALGLAVIEQIEKKQILEHVCIIGSYFLNKLKSISSPRIIDVRGKGLLIGIEMEPQDAKIIIQRCLEKGIYCGIYGQKNEVIRISPPLIITKKIVDQTVKIIKESIHDLENGEISESTINATQSCVSLGN